MKGKNMGAVILKKWGGRARNKNRGGGAKKYMAAGNKKIPLGGKIIIGRKKK